jgi:hypothetical protein
MRQFYAFLVACIYTFSFPLCAASPEIETLMEEYSQNDKGWPALHFAIAQNREDVALEILRRHPEQSFLRIQQDFGSANEAVHFVVQFLKYDPIEVFKLSALNLAIGHGHVQVVEELLNLGVDTDTLFVSLGGYSCVQDGDSGWYFWYNTRVCFYTPLGQAVEYGNTEMTALLLKRNPNLDCIIRFFRGTPIERVRKRVRDGFQSFHIDETWHLSLLGMIHNSPHVDAINPFYQLLICHLLDNKLTPEEIPQEVIELCKKWNDCWDILAAAINGGETESNIALLKQYGFDSNILE